MALPWLADAAVRAGASALGRWPAAESLAGRADHGGADTDWREWLLEGVSSDPDLLRRFPAGPCVRAAWTGERTGGRWACAAPVHLRTALDHLRLAAPAPLPLGPGEAAVLAADINARCADRGFRLHAAGDRGWLCECPPDLECTGPDPAAVVDGNLRDLLPAGRDARRVLAWVNEVQMLLHEHPANAQRSARGLPSVNSIWPWGFGAVEAAEAAEVRPLDALLTDDDWLAGLWSLHGARSASPDGLAAALQGDWPMIRLSVAAPLASGPAQAVAGLESALFAVVRAALASGALHEVRFHVGTMTWTLDRRSGRRCWRRPRPLAEVLA